MANPTIYTRAYSKSSAGQLVSGKRQNGDPLSDPDLVNEFLNHSNKWSTVPTALVSVSTRIVDTVLRAFKMHYEDGDSPADIWVAFILLPATTHETPARVHASRRLAEKCGHPNPSMFSYEMVFEWAIPEKYVLHKVSLQTLINRGLQWGHLSRLSATDLRYGIARDLLGARSRSDPWDIGIYLTNFARCFGARAPLDWISHSLFNDCIWTEIYDDKEVKLQYGRHTETVDFNFFCELEDGIETSLLDWWLADFEFYFDYEEYKEQEAAIEDNIAWEQIEFYETWHVDYDETREISEKEKLLYNKVQNELWAKHEKSRAAVEAQAVEIGL
ncbi:hypothetical protein V500_05822 [Pseudogymnoascus sp. VKM F-4518 (FW-2643)]|nr:hypothetical protein V500_05822 [Pseudogymnoascus sp. VKM F-4518 (FW-2643)]